MNFMLLLLEKRKKICFTLVAKCEKWMGVR